ncbi:MAG: hypothetical protein AB1673_12175 [Actinomycetota bacterium]
MALTRETVAPAGGDALLDSWRSRNCSASASAWLYHLGLDAFSAIEHFRRDPRSAGPFGCLLLRDVVAFASVYCDKGGSQAVTKALISMAAATDLVAAHALRQHIPATAFEADRAMSQFGLSFGWAVQLGSSRGPGERLAAYAAPVAMQVALSSLWGLRGRRRAAYVLREAAWSVIALSCIAQLSALMRQAVDDGYAAAVKLNALAAAENQARATLQARQDTHDHLVNRALVDFAGWAETMAMKAGLAPLVADLARAEADGWRHCPEAGAVTVNCLRLRIVCAPQPGPGTVAQSANLDPADGLLFTRGADHATVSWLTAAARSAGSPLSVELSVSQGSLDLNLAATSFSDLTGRPPAVACSAEAGRTVLAARLALQAGVR